MSQSCIFLLSVTFMVFVCFCVHLCTTFVCEFLLFMRVRFSVVCV